MTNAELPINQLASLLALHCLARGESPEDYLILVPADTRICECVTSQARELLKLGRAISCPVPLSRREEEVLREMLQNLANKEIAARLNISVRTVKFHVSSLLAKFGVHGRWDLIQKASRMLGLGFAPPPPEPLAFPAKPLALPAPKEQQAEPSVKNPGNARLAWLSRRLAPA